MVIDVYKRLKGLGRIYLVWYYREWMREIIIIRCVVLWVCECIGGGL